MITILPETTKDPISLIGRRAGICWGADITDKEKNYKRGLDCIKANHGRTWEFVNVEMVLDGYSARVIREWYTHIGGSPTRLQASTRYINYEDFDFVTPPSVEKNTTIKEDMNAEQAYDFAMSQIKESLKTLASFGIPKEDLANLLPLGMTTKVVDKRNLRSLVEMSHQRMCTRAYWEYREMFNDVITALREVSDEWNAVIDLLFCPKCEMLGYCPETYSCGKFPQKKD